MCVLTGLAGVIGACSDAPKGHDSETPLIEVIGKEAILSPNITVEGAIQKVKKAP